MSNYYNSVNYNSSFVTPPVKTSSGSGIPFYQPNLSQQPNSSVRAQGEMHDVVLDHLRIGDEVVWLPDGKSVSIHKLDIGRVQRTLYHVDHTNQEALLAIVDFHDWLEGSQEVREPSGSRSFRLRVYAKHLKRLGEFLESVNSTGAGRSLSYQDANNNGRGTIKGAHNAGMTNFNAQTQVLTTAGGSRTYVVRPCVLSHKRPTTHPLISESDQIYVSFNNVVLQGLVKRLFLGDGNNFFIGAEFGGAPVYPLQLAHSPSCSFRSNGCESRIGIRVSNLSKHVWDSEFRLFANGTRQITFEDLFQKEDAPPSYSTVVSVTPSAPPPQPQPPPISPIQINYNLPPPASAPPLTPSPPPAIHANLGGHTQNWEQFNAMSPPKRELSYLQPEFQPSPQIPSGSGSGGLSRNYSVSMMNLDSCGGSAAPQPQKPPTSQRPNPSNRQSLLVDELKRKLKIEVKPQPQSGKDSTNPMQIPDNESLPPPPQSQLIPEIANYPPPPPLEIPTQKRVSLNLEPNSFLEELKRRQQGKSGITPPPRPASLDPVKLAPVDDDPPHKQRISLPPKPVLDRGQAQKDAKNGYKRPDFSLPFPMTTKTNYGAGSGSGMTRSSSCMNISEVKPPTTPKPGLAPKPVKTAKITAIVNQFTFPKPETQIKPSSIPTNSRRTLNPVQDLPHPHPNPAIPQRPLPEVETHPPRPPPSKTLPSARPQTPETKNVPQPQPTQILSNIVPQIEAKNDEEFTEPPPPLPSRSQGKGQVSLAQPQPPRKVEEEPKPKPPPPFPPPELTPIPIKSTNTPPNHQLPPIKSNLYPDLGFEKIVATLNQPEPTVQAPPPPTDLRPPQSPVPNPPPPPPPHNFTKSVRFQEPDELPPSLPHSPPPAATALPHPEIHPNQPESKPGRNVISRDNLPPPPPPPPLPAPLSEQSYQDFNNENEADFPPPPPEAVVMPNDPSTEDGADGRGTLLQQIRQGIKLRPRVDPEETESSEHPPQHQSKSTGFENMIKDAIETRRVMMDSDQESDNSDYDEDSDAWD